MTEPTPLEIIRSALQVSTDEQSGDGWTVAHFVCVMGLDRMGPDGVETAVSVCSPDVQADYITEGLLAQGERLRDAAHEEME